MSNNKLTSGISRVDADKLLRALYHIASHGGVAIPELQDVIGLSRASLSRLIVNSRRQYGVIITWRKDGHMPSAGEYTIEDWGVFDRARVLAFLRVKTERDGEYPRQPTEPASIGKICAFCGQPFTAKSEAAKTCSDRCRSKLSSSNNRVTS